METGQTVPEFLMDHMPTGDVLTWESELDTGIDLDSGCHDDGAPVLSPELGAADTAGDAPDVWIGGTPAIESGL
jgi:hypothetical protein